MTGLFSLLSLIPDVIWSGVIAALLTLSGVLILNRSNTVRLRLQLQHDANERSKERTATLRRDVYLRAAEELTRANAYLAALPQADLAKTNASEGLQGFFAAAAKLQLVAEPTTALLVNQLVGTYGELLLRLLVKLIPLQEARTDIAIRDDHYNKAQTEVARILAEMERFNEAAQTNAAVFRALSTALEFHQSQSAKFAAERSEFWEQYNRLHIEFVRNLLTEMRQIGEHQIPVLIEIRRDLGLTGELHAFQVQMQEQWKRMAEQLDKTLNALKND